MDCFTQHFCVMIFLFIRNHVTFMRSVMLMSKITGSSCESSLPHFKSINLLQYRSELLFNNNRIVFRSPQVSGSSAGSPAGSSASSSSSRQYSRQRITRVNLRDFIFYMEQERETSRSLLLYRALLK